MLAVGEPETNGKYENKEEDNDGVVHLAAKRRPHVSTPNHSGSLGKGGTHIFPCNREHGRKEKDNSHEPVPGYSNHIDRGTPTSEVPRTSLEPPVQHLAYQWDDVTEIQGNRAHVEHSADGRRAC